MVYHNLGPLERVSTGKDERLLEEQCSVVLYTVVTAFVPDYVLKDVCVADSLRR